METRDVDLVEGAGEGRRDSGLGEEGEALRWNEVGGGDGVRGSTLLVDKCMASPTNVCQSNISFARSLV